MSDFERGNLMDDGELEFCAQDAFANPKAGDLRLSSRYSMDNFFDELLKDAHTCTHTHTCNAPNGADDGHTHTCFHVHTKILPGSNNEHVISDDTAECTEKATKKRPLGNRAAVRKYREKKKAQTACLEEEVHKLRTINQQLMKRLAVSEAELARHKYLLVGIRERIDGEIGSFPYQNMGKGRSNGIMNSNVGVQPVMSGGYVLNSCDLRCDDRLNCLQPGVEGGGGYVLNSCDLRCNDRLDCLHPGVEGGVLDDQRLGLCEFGDMHCPGILSSGLEFENCGHLNDEAIGISLYDSTRKEKNPSMEA